MERGRHKTEILDRLKKIEGQVRGLMRMVEEDRYCVDILIQVASVRAALDRVGKQLLEDHTSHCVTRAVREGRQEEAVQELMEVLDRFIR